MEKSNGVHDLLAFTQPQLPIGRNSNCWGPPPIQENYHQRPEKYCFHWANHEWCKWGANCKWPHTVVYPPHRRRVRLTAEMVGKLIAHLQETKEDVLVHELIGAIRK